MKHVRYLLVFVFLAAAGCDYEAPLTMEHVIPIDPSVLGLWEEVHDDGAPADPEGRMLIMKYSDTEYVVHYPTGKGGMYFRAYPINVGGVACVQIQLIGNAEGDLKGEDRKYQVMSYALSGGVLELRTMNTDVVDKNLKDSAALREAFLKNKDDRNLFRDPGKFRKVK